MRRLTRLLIPSFLRDPLPAGFALAGGLVAAILVTFVGVRGEQTRTEIQRLQPQITRTLDAPCVGLSGVQCARRLISACSDKPACLTFARDQLDGALAAAHPRGGGAPQSGSSPGQKPGGVTPPGPPSSSPPPAPKPGPPPAPVPTPQPKPPPAKPGPVGHVCTILPTGCPKLPPVSLPPLPKF